jgi:hypothetical protein
MNANDRNEKFDDKNNRSAKDSEGAPDGSEGELSQDELNNVSGGAMRRNESTGQSDVRVGRYDDKNDPNEGSLRSRVQG